jgi:hypothetical protein
MPVAVSPGDHRDAPVAQARARVRAAILDHGMAFAVAAHDDRDAGRDGFASGRGSTQARAVVLDYGVTVAVIADDDRNAGRAVPAV